MMSELFQICARPDPLSTAERRCASFSDELEPSLGTKYLAGTLSTYFASCT